MPRRLLLAFLFPSNSNEVLDEEAVYHPTMLQIVKHVFRKPAEIDNTRLRRSLAANHKDWLHPGNQTLSRRIARKEMDGSINFNPSSTP